MAQFRAYRLPAGGVILDLQSDLIDTPLRVVAPMRPAAQGARPYTRLAPALEVEGTQLSLRINELLSVPAKLVSGSPVADLSAQRDAITRALGVLISGF